MTTPCAQESGGLDQDWRFCPWCGRCLILAERKALTDAEVLAWAEQHGNLDGLLERYGYRTPGALDRHLARGLLPRYRQLAPYGNQPGNYVWREFYRLLGRQPADTVSDWELERRIRPPGPPAEEPRHHPLPSA